MRHNLRKLHSLTGVVPVGAFLLEHFFTNSFAMFGAEAFNEKVKFLQGMPYVVAMEIGLIAVPIVFHAVLGVMIWWEGRSNAATYGYLRNWKFVFQRVTGLFLVVFIAVHVVKTRFAGIAADEMFQHMAGYLSNPWWTVFYAAGVLSAAFHFGNGLFGFAVSWGIVPGERGQKLASWVGGVVFVTLALVGLNALLAFTGSGFDLLNHPETR